MELLGAKEKRGLCGTSWMPPEHPINLPQGFVNHNLLALAAGVAPHPFQCSLAVQYEPFTVMNKQACAWCGSPAAWPGMYKYRYIEPCE